MKTIKKISVAVILLMTMVNNPLSAQEATTAEIKIKTSAVCNMCKETIERNLAFEKGIKKSTLDVNSKILTVTYNPEKITPENIRLAISKIGYDADDVAANPKAYKKLDDCCKKGKVCTDMK
jgi:periplasmic mercuric ion binding protein